MVSLWIQSNDLLLLCPSKCNSLSRTLAPVEVGEKKKDKKGRYNGHISLYDLAVPSFKIIIIGISNSIPLDKMDAS